MHRWRQAAGAALGAAWLCCAATACAATDEDAQRAFDAGDFPTARASWAPLAAAGDPKAQLGLGVLYDLGDGVAQEPNTALQWYRRAAEAGLPDAELNVAVMYDSGRGTQRSAVDAALWYARAAAHHDHRAEYDLAQLYEAGDGVPKNLQLANAWLRAAAAGGLDAAGERLAARQPHAEPHGAPRPALLPAALSYPAAAASIPRLSVTRDVELVWTATPEPVATKFYVEMLATGSDAPVPVFSGYTDVSSILVPVAPAQGAYIWRVYVVGAALHGYLPSGWSRFQIVWRGSEGAG